MTPVWVVDGHPQGKVCLDPLLRLPGPTPGRQARASFQWYGGPTDAHGGRGWCGPERSVDGRRTVVKDTGVASFQVPDSRVSFFAIRRVTGPQRPGAEAHATGTASQSWADGSSTEVWLLGA